MSAGAASAELLQRPPGELRDAVRQTLLAQPLYETLSAEDRRVIAHSLVRIAHAGRLLEDEVATPAPATARTVALSRAMSASDELGGKAVASMAGATRNMINAISFPRFVNELITGVFKAMLETNQQQLQQYVALVRGVSQSLDGFAALGGDDDMAKRWLADQFPQSFAIEAPDPEDKPDPGEKPPPLQLVTRGPPPSQDALRAALSLEPGEDVPSSGGPELIAFVRRSLARNRQQMLATMVQMGMQRIVIDSGRISAGMRFHIDAASAAAEQRHTGVDTRTTIGASGSVGFGWWSASASLSSTIGYVSTTDTQTREEVNAAADLTSSVELHFRTDQVPLDRIASQQTVQRLQLNTLNPERELQIAAETDRARISANQGLETARTGRPAAPLAPMPTSAPPAAPALDPAAVAAHAGLPAPTSRSGAQPANPAGAPATRPAMPVGTGGSAAAISTAPVASTPSADTPTGTPTANPATTPSVGVATPSPPSPGTGAASAAPTVSGGTPRTDASTPVGADRLAGSTSGRPTNSAGTSVGALTDSVPAGARMGSATNRP